MRAAVKFLFGPQELRSVHFRVPQIQQSGTKNKIYLQHKLNCLRPTIRKLGSLRPLNSWLEDKADQRQTENSSSYVSYEVKVFIIHISDVCGGRVIVSAQATSAQATLFYHALTTTSCD